MPAARESASPSELVEQWLRAAEADARVPVAGRVEALLAGVRAGSERYQGESWDQASERHAEDFLRLLREQFPGRVLEVSRPPAAGELELLDPSLGDDPLARPHPFQGAEPVVIVERQRLPVVARRTTSWNYIFTVPGERPERLLLVAHYDTWRGPGADDNTTGEEISKQYLLHDLRMPRRPPLTHSYVLAGSEECGLIGFTSQLLLAAGFGLANIALTHGIYWVIALGLASVPLAKFRFGVSGSREYVRSLSAEEIAQIQSVISVDSVGEGRIYIPETSLGADFVRAFLPFHGYEALDDLLEEAAHLNGIKYNTFLSGGTTDHVSFLEVNSTLRDRLGDWLGCPRWLGCHRQGRRKIPAAALVAMSPGKASPVVFGGKIHTPADLPARVYPEPLAQTLHILDYWFHLMQGGGRIAEPRELTDYQYARLYRVTLPQPGGPPRQQYWLALKDAIEPNRRNINGLYRVEAEVADGVARCRAPEILDWGVHTRLRHEVEEHLAGAGSYERLPVSRLELAAPSATLHFAARPARPLAALASACHWALGRGERFLGSNTFLTFFAAAYLLAKGVDLGLNFAFAHSIDFQIWFFKLFVVTLPSTILAELWVMLWLIGKKIPTLIDNNYRHLNRSDNLLSLRRVAAPSHPG